MIMHVFDVSIPHSQKPIIQNSMVHVNFLKWIQNFFIINVNFQNSIVNSLDSRILRVSLVRRPRSGRRTSETLQRIRRESAYAVVSVARCAKRRARAWRSRASRSLAIQVEKN